MSSTSVAPRLSVNGPVPTPPLHSLVATADALADIGHWEAGATIYPYPCGLPSGHDPCSLGTFREKEEPDPVTVPESFPTFTAYLGEICSAMGIGNWEEWKSRVAVAFDAAESWALERQLVSAEFMEGPHLGDANVDVIAGSPAPLTAIAHLEDAIAASGRQGVLHLTPSVATYLNLNDELDDGVLRTASGTPIIVGQGYVGADPPTGGGAAAAGQSWIYASGGVVYRRGAMQTLPETIGEALDRSDNTVIYRAERDLWVAFDPCVQSAILADWTP